MSLGSCSADWASGAVPTSTVVISAKPTRAGRADNRSHIDFPMPWTTSSPPSRRAELALERIEPDRDLELQAAVALTPPGAEHLVESFEALIERVDVNVE